MKSKKNYALLERRIFFKFCYIILLLLVTLWTIAYCIRGSFGTWIILLLQKLFHFNEADAAFFYQTVIRHNIYLIMLAILIISIIFVFRFLLSSITRYFDTVEHAIENLTTPQQKISLPIELSFMEIKLQICRDMLEKKMQEAKIAEQKKNDLVVYLAHDIKTPLTSIIGYLELLTEFPDMPIEKKDKYTKITLDKANRLEQLINEFFEITRYNLNTIVLEKKWFNLTFMLEQLVDEFYPMLQTKQITVTLSTPTKIKYYGDSDKLSRVFNNILRNAISYSHPSSTITILQQETNNQLTIVINNTGDPIPSHQLETIFDKFFRLDAARNSRTGGAGLGLAIAKDIVQAHQGTIKATSDVIKTSIIVTLPMVSNKDTKS